jgi:hypothetical protein
MRRGAGFHEIAISSLNRSTASTTVANVGCQLPVGTTDTCVPNGFHSLLYRLVVRRRSVGPPPTHTTCGHPQWLARCIGPLDVPTANRADARMSICVGRSVSRASKQPSASSACSRVPTQMMRFAMPCRNMSRANWFQFRAGQLRARTCGLLRAWMTMAPANSARGVPNLCHAVGLRPKYSTGRSTWLPSFGRYAATWPCGGTVVWVDFSHMPSHSISCGRNSWAKSAYSACRAGRVQTVTCLNVLALWRAMPANMISWPNSP